MKSKLSFNLCVGMLAMATLVGAGCRKKPVGVTPLPGSRAGNVSGTGPGGMIEGGGPGGLQSGNGVTGNGMNEGTQMSGTDRSNWRQDRDMFKSDSVYFDYDSSAIKENEKQKIETVASYFKSNTGANVALKIEGNCDERGTEEYNRSLGERRAQAIREYLIRSGVSGERIDTVSFGEDKPMASGHNEAAWKQNRRGDFVVLNAP